MHFLLSGQGTILLDGVQPAAITTIQEHLAYTTCSQKRRQMPDSGQVERVWGTCKLQVGSPTICCSSETRRAYRTPVLAWCTFCYQLHSETLIPIQKRRIFGGKNEKKKAVHKRVAKCVGDRVDSQNNGVHSLPSTHLGRGPTLKLPQIDLAKECAPPHTHTHTLFS